MRKQFTEWMEKKAKENSNILFLTGDLGFNALENLQSIMGERFINASVAEQNMISMAAALAHLQNENGPLVPYCYSIAPFLVFRACEQIRLDISLHEKKVRLIGNGGGFTYGIMGATHHALEDIAVLSSFSHFKCFIPYSNTSLPFVCDLMDKYEGPSYLRLGFSNKSDSHLNFSFENLLPLTCLKESPLSSLTVLALGPLILNIDMEDTKGCDLFSAIELPLNHLSSNFKTSLLRTKKLLILEDHVERGGLGENISKLILKEGLGPYIEDFQHLFAKYPENKSSGNQDYYLECCHLDSKSLHFLIQKMIAKAKENPNNLRNQ